MRVATRLAALGLVALAVACADRGLELGRNGTPLITRDVLAGNPDKASIQISPDGSMIGYRAPLEGVMNVWVGPASDPAVAEPITFDEGRGIPFYGWAWNGEHILYVQDEQGDENWRVYSVDLETKAPAARHQSQAPGRDPRRTQRS